MASGNPNIPHITVTTDFALTHWHSMLVHETEQTLSPKLLVPWWFLLFSSSAKHGRRPSWASSSEGHSSLDGTVPNHGAVSLSPLRRVTSAAAGTTAESPTNMYVDNLSECSRPRSRRMQKDNADSESLPFLNILLNVQNWGTIKKQLKSWVIHG